MIYIQIAGQRARAERDDARRSARGGGRDAMVALAVAGATTVAGGKRRSEESRVGKRQRVRMCRTGAGKLARREGRTDEGGSTGMLRGSSREERGISVARRFSPRSVDRVPATVRVSEKIPLVPCDVYVTHTHTESSAVVRPRDFSRGDPRRERSFSSPPPLPLSSQSVAREAERRSSRATTCVVVA